MTGLTTPSGDAKSSMPRTPPGVCVRNCPFRVLCDAASGPPATTPVAVDLPWGSAARTPSPGVPPEQEPTPGLDI
jgi:hypothetical protein